MDATKKLYDLDAYAREFDAKVISCTQITIEDETCYQVILDQTLFFPEEGGQSPDQGTLKGHPVLDVQIKEGIILHYLPVPLAAGESVHGSLYWEHRFSNMQQHSGEHIFSGLVHKQFGYDNVGFHLSNQIVTMDFNGVLSKEEAAAVELQANEIIVQNLAIQAFYPSLEELAALDYRSKIEIAGPTRIVSIAGVDMCACCAPHVKRTGEIGILKIMNMQNYKGGVRISILCGFRALKDFQQRITVISGLSSILSANQDSLCAAAEKLKESNQSLKYELTAQKLYCLNLKIENIPKEEENVCLFEDGLDAQVMRKTVNQLVTAHFGACAIFSGNEEEGFQFILGSAKKDAKDRMAVLKDKFGAQGGGSPAMVQGFVRAKKEDLLSCFISNK